MTRGELQLVEALLGGPQQAGKLPFPETSRRRYVNGLESRGLLARKNGIYKLTKAGWEYAIAQGYSPHPTYSVLPIANDMPAEHLIAPTPPSGFWRELILWVTFWVPLAAIAGSVTLMIIYLVRITP